MKKVKILLVWLFSLIWLINFWYCLQTTDYWDYVEYYVEYPDCWSRWCRYTLNIWREYYMFEYVWNNTQTFYFYDYDDNTITSQTDATNWYNLEFAWWRQWVAKSKFYVVNGVRVRLYKYTSLWGGGSCEEQYTSEECQSVYGLVSSWVLNACQSSLSNCQSSLSGCQSSLSNCQSSLSWYSNTLSNCSNNLNTCNVSLSNCLSANCPFNTWDVQWSALFINDIQHIWAPLINITIPEEFEWNYTWSNDEFDLDVVWYNVDTEYIDWIIRTQKTTPDSYDFNNIVSNLIPLFVPWLVIVLFLWFIFRFIKKIF